MSEDINYYKNDANRILNLWRLFLQSELMELQNVKKQTICE